VSDEFLSAADCLREFRSARAEVEALAARVSSWTVEDGDGWNAKDHLAHLSAWQERMVRWFEEGARGKVRDRPEPDFGFDQIDELNARDFGLARERPLPEVQATFARTADAVEALIASLNDDDLNRADRYPWLGFEARHTIIGNTFGHHREHLDHLRALVERSA
jgi:hypothetical protein